MKNLIWVIVFILTVFNVSGQVLPISARRAERNYSIVAQRAIAKMQREELIEDSKLPPEARHTKGGVRDEWSAFRMKVVPWHTGDQKGLFLG